MKHFLKAFLIFIPLLVLFPMCLTNNEASISTGNQASIGLDEAINNSTQYLSGRFPRGTRAAIFAMQSADQGITDFAVSRISTALVNQEWFIVVERGASAMDSLSGELNYQMSGYVSDETSLSIGKQLGAEVIIRGALVRSGQNWRLDVQALQVESAQVAGQWFADNIRADPLWASPHDPAAEIESKVREAVSALAARLNNTMEVSIGKLTLAGTDTSSEFSLYLNRKINHYAVNNNRFRVVAPTRSLSRASWNTGTISGSYNVEGDTVEVFLQLVSDSNNISLGSQRFFIQAADLKRIPIEILPANINTSEAAIKHEEIFTPPARPVTDQSFQTDRSFQIEAWSNSASYTFFDGENLQIYVLSNQDCFFKIYHIDVSSKVQMIFPNAGNQNNRLQANTMRTIPDGGLRYRIQAPFGQDSIIVVASRVQFENLEAEFTRIEQATQNTIGGLMLGRGIGVEAAPVRPAAETVTTRFNFTSLPSNSILRDPDF